MKSCNISGKTQLLYHDSPADMFCVSNFNMGFSVTMDEDSGEFDKFIKFLKTIRREKKYYDELKLHSVDVSGEYFDDYGDKYWILHFEKDESDFKLTLSESDMQIIIDMAKE